MFLRAFRPGPYPKQCSPRLPVQPRLAGGGHERLGYFCTGSSVRHLICEVFFFLPIMLPSVIPKLPADQLVRGFPGVWKLLLHHYPSRKREGEGSPSRTHLSLFLSFIFCPTAFQRQWAAVLGVWCPPPVLRGCFVALAQCSNDLSMN